MIRYRIFVVMMTLVVPMKPVLSQSLPICAIQKIDSLFVDWNSTNSPGCAVGIVRGDSLIYARGFGMANLEYDVANTPETIFHIASISKQFTAWSIILLAREGKLGLDDDVRKYLPWFPNLGAKITPSCKGRAEDAEVSSCRRLPCHAGRAPKISSRPAAI